MKAAAINLMLFSCLAYSACTDSSFKNSKRQIEYASKQIGNFEDFLYNISRITECNNSGISTFIEDLRNKKIEVSLKSASELKELIEKFT